MQRSIAAMLGMIAISAAASAQNPSAPDDKDIVVTAREQTVVEQFVQNLTDPARSDQVPRWDTPLCTGVAGLAPPHAVVLNGRIEAAAKLVKLPLGGENCRPNVIILVTPRPGQIAARLRAKYPRTLAQEGRAKLREFAETTSAVRWISQVAEVPYDGSPLIPSDPGRAPTGRLTGSRLQKSTRTVLSNMLVIVDAERLAGRQLGQIGDYLAMVVLAKPKLDAPAPAGSILALFDDGAPPDGLGADDRRFLTALYKAPASVSAKVQRSAMRGEMEKDERP